jgi:F-type H+-transporting ATPase subunit epsilon
VVHLRLPGESGQFGVLANHAPLMSALNFGCVEAKDEENVFLIAISGGFTEVLPDKTIILAETAELRDNIDVDRAKASLSRARTRLAEKSPDLDVERAQSSLARALNRLRVAEMK